MTLLRQIEQVLDQRLRAAFGGSRENSREAIELYRELLEEVSSRTTPGHRGAPVFPFNRIRISLKAESAERRAVLKTIFSPEQLSNDVLACLKESRATAPADLAIEITFDTEQTDEMKLTFEREETAELPLAALPVETAAPPPTAERIPTRLTTLAGESSRDVFDLNGVSVDIGRGPEVIDTAGRTIRRNGLFFLDDAAPGAVPGINASVSRAHAHLLFDASSGGWRIFDDGSSFGTSIFRNGQRIDVPAHAARGVGLQPGDEIWLGHACLRFETADSGPERDKV